jgi:transposase-like protein
VREIHPIDSHGHTRRGVQRFKCQDCGRSFCLRRQRKKRYSGQFAEEVTRRHVEERTSYRVLAKRYRENLGVGVSASSLQRMVETVGMRCKTPAEMSRTLGLDMWRGYLLTDDKHIGVGGKRLVWYLAVDKCGDIVHAGLLMERTVGSMVEFFETVRDDVGYHLRGLTTDQEQLLALGFERVYAGKPHQYCLKHAYDSLDRLLGYHRQRDRYKILQRRIQDRLRGLPDRGSTASVQRTWEEVIRGHDELKRLRQEMQPVEILRKAIRRVLGARTYSAARARWAAFHRHPLRHRKAHQQIIDYITPRWRHLTVHYHHHGMPATNNIAESTMRQLERRLKTIEGFARVNTAKGYVNLLIAYLRAKPFTDCRGIRKYRNGLSRLELAGAQLPTKDWLKLSLKS